MSFEQKTWYNDGVVPDDAPEGTVAPCIDADNLNRIEGGIVDALNATKINAEKIKKAESDLKSYADNNILYFSKSCTSTAGSWATLFQLPSTIDYTKYIPLVECSRITNGWFLKVIPYDTNVTLWYESWKSLQIKISSSGEVSFYDPGSSNSTFTVRVILLPVNTISIA